MVETLIEERAIIDMIVPEKALTELEMSKSCIYATLCSE
jgi:hypothetical protein